MRPSGRSALLAALLAAAASLTACASGNVHEDAGPIRAYTVPGFGALALEVPPGWKDSVEAAEGGIAARVITFQPPSGHAFVVKVFAGGNRSGQPGFNSPARLRLIVERQGHRLLRSAVEPTLTVVPLPGEEVRGYYFTLTDKIAVEHPTTTGDYPRLTQGVASVGDLLVSFSIYFREPFAPEREAALAMIAHSRHIAGPGSRLEPGGPAR